MVIKIKNKKLHKETFQKIKKYDNKAMKAYEKGNMKQGKEWEKKSDSAYAKNYKKMFEFHKASKKLN